MTNQNRSSRPLRDDHFGEGNGATWNAASWQDESVYNLPAREQASKMRPDRTQRGKLRPGWDDEASFASGPQGWTDSNWAAPQQRDKRRGSNGSRSNGKSSNRWTEWAESTMEWAAQRLPGGHRLRTGANMNAANISNRSLMGQLTGTRRRLITTAMLAIFLFTCIVPTLLGGAIAAVPAWSGLQHLKAAQTDLKALSSHPFKQDTINATRDELSAANRDFTAANGGIQIVPGLLGYVPLAGSRVGAAQRIVPIAIQATNAGIVLCDALSIVAPKMQNLMDASAGSGLNDDDIAALTAKFQQIKGIFDQLSVQIANLQPSDADIDPRVGPLLLQLKAQLPSIQQSMNDFSATLPYLPTLLGIDAPSQYLLEVMDSSEIRPGGGFIGNNGFVTITGGHLGGISMKDVDLLDKSVKECVPSAYNPLPSQYSWFSGYMAQCWGFRDSNLDADFPTSAKNGQQLYTKEAGASAETTYGVVAITPWLILNALKVTGPISIPEFTDPQTKTAVQVTADNLVSQIHFWQLGVGGSQYGVDKTTGTSDRKKFSGYLFKHFMDTVKANTQKDMGPLIRLILDSLKTKDIQIYLNPEPAESLLVHRHFGSTIEAPPSGDSFFAVNANYGASKSDVMITHVLSDQVTIDANGNTTHNTTITYTWMPDKKDKTSIEQTYPYDGNSVYGYNYTYQRIYLPPRARISADGVTGWADNGTAISSIQTTFSRLMVGGEYSVKSTDKKPHVISFTWSVPNSATHDGSGWHYNYLIQRQAGIFYNYDVTITMPSCAHDITLGSGLTSSDGHTVTLSPQPLNQDTTLTANYSC